MVNNVPERGMFKSPDEVAGAFVRAPALLLATGRLLIQPDVWLREQLASAADGREVAPASAEASRFCLVGALLRSAAVAGVAEPLAHAVDAGPDGPPAAAPQLQVSVCASLLVVAFGWTDDRLPIGDSANRSAAAGAAVVLLVDEDAYLGVAGRGARLLPTLTALNDAFDMTLETLTQGIVAAVKLAGLVTSSFNDPVRRRALDAYLRAAREPEAAGDDDG